MKFDNVVSDVVTTVKRILFGLDNGLTARDNFAPDGTAGQVLTSNGPNSPPTWQNK